MIGSTLFIWNDAPTSNSEPPTVAIDPNAYGLRGGDGSMVASAGDRLFVSDYNANRVLVYDEIPTTSTAEPAFTLGTPDLHTDTLAENHFITNGIPVTNGESLCVGDGYDLRLHCWEEIPSETGIEPTVTIDTNDGVTAMALHEQTLLIAGPVHGLLVWDEIPFDGSAPDQSPGTQLGTQQMGEIRALAMDDHYFYAVDGMGTLHAWHGVPGSGESPVISMPLSPGEIYLHSDGEYLSVSSPSGFTAYPIDQLDDPTTAIEIPVPANSALLAQGIVSHDKVFWIDRGFNRVYLWEELDDARAGETPGVLLGASDWDDRDPTISRDGLFWPQRLAYDGDDLWVAEFKFSGRVLGYPSELGGD